jgi:hypothetical protein
MNNKVVIKNKIKKILKIQIQIIFSGKNKNKINRKKIYLIIINNFLILLTNN